MRRVISIALTASFVLVSLTGLVLEIRSHDRPYGGPGPGMAGPAGPPGGPAPADAHAMPPDGPPGGPPAHHGIFPRPLHEWTGLLMILAGLGHIVLNWKPLLCHFGLRRRGTQQRDCPPDA